MLNLVTAPATEPITISEARTQLLLGATAGEPAPSAPTLALANPAAPGDCTNGAWRVGFTFVTPDGETELGQLSAALTVADKTVNGQIAVAGISLGGATVTARKGYAVAPGETVAKLFITIANNTATSCTLNVAAAGLGVQAPTVNTTVDPELIGLIATVRGRGELASRRAFITQTWDLLRGGFPSNSIIELPKPPLQSVTWIKYVDLNGDLQTLSADLYTVQTYAGEQCARGTISLAYGQSWPSTRDQLNAVTVRFVAGYGAAAAVPAMLRAAMKIDLASLHLNRGDQETSLPSVSAGIYRSFKSYARYDVGEAA